MSAPLFTVEEPTPRGYKYGLAVRLLNEVVPSILSINVPLSRRIALAYGWYVYLQENAPRLCASECEGLESDYRLWGGEELAVIARALARHASSLLRDVLRGERGREGGPPRPPI